MNGHRWRAWPFLLALGLVGTAADPASAAATVQWTSQFGSPLEDRAAATAIVGGAVYVGGRAEGSIIPADEDAHGGFLRKYSATGTEVWTRQYGFRPSAIEAIAGDDGGLFAVGLTLNESSVMRIDPVDGSIMWQRPISDPRPDVGAAARAVAMGVDGIYVAGVHEGLLNGATWSADAWLRSYTDAGTLRWSRPIRTDAVDEATDVAVSGASAYVSGTISGVVDGARVWDAWVRRYAANGSLRWERRFGGAGRDEATSVAAEGAAVFVSGITTGMPGASRFGGSDGYVRRLTSTGRREWTTEFGTEDTDLAYALAVRPRGLYVTGWTRGALGVTEHGGYDAFVQAMGWGGGVRRAIQFGTPRDDHAWAVALAEDDLVIAGDTNGRFHTQARYGGIDAFSRRYSLG
jgi:hypothetical protein